MRFQRLAGGKYFTPNGVPAISRWLSETTPPELEFAPYDPERVAAMSKLEDESYDSFGALIL